MAMINGLQVDLGDFSFEEIGAVIINKTGNVNGQGLTVQLMQWEEARFIDEFGLDVGEKLAELIADALEQKTGARPEPEKFKHTYSEGRFVT